jgi:ACT domain
VAAGVDFSFVIGTRKPDKPGTGSVYFGGLRGEKQSQAADLAGFVKSNDAHGLRVVARDRPRLLHRLTSQLASAAINLRSVSASVIKSRCVMVFAFDAETDRDKAAELLAAL